VERKEETIIAVGGNPDALCYGFGLC